MASNQAPVVDRIRIIPRPDDFLDRNVGASGEVFFDKQANTLRLYSGKSAGGYAVVTENNLSRNIANAQVATVTYTVTINNTGEGNKYILNGDYKPELNFVVGYTYVFDQSDQTNVYYPNPDGGTLNQHQLHFSSNNLNGLLADGDVYENNVQYYLDDDLVTRENYNSKFNAATTRQVQITVTSDTPSTLYYWCKNHLNMGNSIAVANPGSGSGGGVGGGASVDISDTAPVSAQEGNIWFNSTNGSLFVYVTDVDSSQWVQPTAPVPAINTFSSVTVTGAAGSIDASGNSDTLTLAPGTNVTMSLNAVTNTITINSAGDGGGGGGGGEAYDQTLNTTSNVSFASIQTPSFSNNGVGGAVLTSASTLTLTAPDGIAIENIYKQTELLSTITNASGVVTHDFSTNAIFNHTSLAANFTANFTNVPTTSNRAINAVLVLNQGASAYIPNAVQIGGVAQTIKWVGATAPEGTINAVDVISFSLLRIGTSWTVLGSYSNYG